MNCFKYGNKFSDEIFLKKNPFRQTKMEVFPQNFQILCSTLFNVL